MRRLRALQSGRTRGFVFSDVNHRVVSEPDPDEFAQSLAHCPDITVSFRHLQESLAGPAYIPKFWYRYSHSGGPMSKGYQRLRHPHDVFDRPPKNTWSYRCYRGPSKQSVQVYHAYSLATSECLARQFLNEPVIGFDVEWPLLRERKYYSHFPLNMRLSHIQLACEDKIGIFHLSHIDAQTVDELIAPSLRNIIESSKIAKAGIAVNFSDFRVIRQILGFAPRGGLDLNHLETTINLDVQQKAHLYQPKKLPAMVEEYFGLPFQKRRAKETQQGIWPSHRQRRIAYRSEVRHYYQAADDAYAGYMLFHHLNRKRLAKGIVLPLPPYAEKTREHLASPLQDCQVELPDKYGSSKLINTSQALRKAQAIWSLNASILKSLKKQDRTWLIWDLIRSWTGDESEGAPLITEWHLKRLGIARPEPEVFPEPGPDMEADLDPALEAKLEAIALDPHWDDEVRDMSSVYDRWISDAIRSQARR